MTEIRNYVLYKPDISKQARNVGNVFRNTCCTFALAHDAKIKFYMI